MLNPKPVLAKTAAKPRGRPKSFQDKSEQNTVQSLDRAMMILRRLSETDGVTLTELAGLTGQSTATVYRVLQTLQSHHLVETEGEQLWHIGAGAFRIGSVFMRRTKVVDRARPFMQALMRATGETANLGIEQQDEVLFLAQVETPQAIRAFFPPGTKSPMHVSGIGKALLAFYPAARVRAIIAAHGLPGFTPLTHTSQQALLADLGQIRARGYAIDDQERAEGMRCVAAPIFNAHGEPIAGLSVSGPAFRMEMATFDRMGAEVCRAADAVTQATGGERPADIGGA